MSLLEAAIILECNLKCKGCTSFSDYHIHDNDLDWGQIRLSLIQWLKRIDAGSISLFGGEPTMHPHLSQIIRDVRSFAPRPMIHIVTNGIGLKNKSDIVDALHEVGHSLLTFSMHQPNKKYTQESKDFLLSKFKWQPCSFNSNWLETSNQFFLEIREETHFYKVFKGEYGNIKPFNNDPSEAFKLCCFHDSLQLYHDKLYKCQPLALLPKVLNDWNQSDDLDWQDPLKYQPLSIDCSDEELLKFFNQINKPDVLCSMCPTSADPEGQRITRGQWAKKPNPNHIPIILK